MARSLHAALHALAGCAAGTYLGYLLSDAERRRREAAADGDGDGDEDDASTQTTTAPAGLDDAIVREHVTRNVQYFGEEPVAGLREDSFVVVVGVGGVGSHAAMALLRAGVGRMRVVDFDRVSLSSLNRHAVATRADVGTPKVDALAAHCASIFPESRVDALDAMYTPDTSDAVLAPFRDGTPVSFVIDAIDNVDTKVHLLLTCHTRGIRIVASGGAAMKADPTRVRVGDIAEAASHDVLLRTVRLRLRKANDSKDVPIACVASTEKARMGLWECPDDVPLVGAGDVRAQAEGGGAATAATAGRGDLQVVPGFRVRTAPVVGTLPATFGLVLAHYVLCALTSNAVPMDPEPMARALDVQYKTLWENLRELETDAFGDDGAVEVTVDEVKYVSRELFHCLPATGGKKNGARGGKLSLVRNKTALRLARFDGAHPAAVDNLVLLGWEDAEAHYATQCDVDAFVARHGDSVASLVRRCSARARRDYAYTRDELDEVREAHREDILGMD